MSLTALSLQSWLDWLARNARVSVSSAGITRARHHAWLFQWVLWDQTQCLGVQALYRRSCLPNPLISYFWRAKRFLQAFNGSPACCSVSEAENLRFLRSPGGEAVVGLCVGREGVQSLQRLLQSEGGAHLHRQKALLPGLKLTPPTYITVSLFNQCSATRISYIQSSERAIKMLIKNS